MTAPVTTRDKKTIPVESYACFVLTPVPVAPNPSPFDNNFTWIDVRRIPLAGLSLASSQPLLNPDRIAFYVEHPDFVREDGTEHPHLIFDGTNLWVDDGHHRIAAAVERGDETIEVEYSTTED